MPAEIRGTHIANLWVPFLLENADESPAKRGSEKTLLF